MSRRQDEFRLHCWLSDTLAIGCRKDVVYFHVPNGEYRPIETARRLKRMSLLPGVPDFIFLQPHRPPDFLELKAPDEKLKLSPAQEEFRDRVLPLGCRFAVADNGEQAVEILTDWGILRMRVSA